MDLTKCLFDVVSAQKHNYRKTNGYSDTYGGRTSSRYGGYAMLYLGSQNFPKFLLSLMRVLGDEHKTVHTRILAGLILKNNLNSEEREWEKGWAALDVALKVEIKKGLLGTLSSPVKDARRTSAQVIAKISGIEPPDWPELIGILVLKVEQGASHEKQASLDTLGYLFEDVFPKVDLETLLCEDDYVSPDMETDRQIKTILLSVVECICSKDVNRVCLAATNVLCNSIGLVVGNFSDVHLCDLIMGAVVKTASSSDVKIRKTAFECLVRIGLRYYPDLGDYIPNILVITAKAIRMDEEPVALKAIEFWKSILDKETNIREMKKGKKKKLIEVIKDALTSEVDEPDALNSVVIPNDVILNLVEIFLETLVRQDEDECDWNIAIAGGECLRLLARKIGDNIVPLVGRFIEENITKTDWRQLEAAVHAFGSILRGPSQDKLHPVLYIAIESMIAAALKTDQNSYVKNTIVWTFGRIFKFLQRDKPIFTSENYRLIIDVLLQSMKDVQSPKVAEKAGKAFYSLVYFGYLTSAVCAEISTSLISVVETLHKVIESQDKNVSDLLKATALKTLKVICIQQDVRFLRMPEP